VTGSSRNTGFGIALRFAQEGARVVINGSSPEHVADAARRIREETRQTVIEAPADLSTPDGVKTLFAAVQKDLGGLDVLVNNAVALGSGPSFVDVTDEQLVSVFELNVFGYFRCGQAAARLMIDHGVRGAIVNIGSNVAARSIRNRTAYCASKGAIDSLTRAMALDLAPHGIRVNNVAPGYILTDRWDRIPESTATRRRMSIPLAEPATANDVAEAVLYLASSAAGNVTGSRIVVDGGCMSQLMPRDADV
jgi:NAD(P)-dependent dehydrogenase (short-subunit alcohol dehydrogenase family)